MALSNLAGWTEEKVASDCGSACGASEKPEENRSIPKSGCLLLPKMLTANFCSFLHILQNSIPLNISGLG